MSSSFLVGVSAQIIDAEACTASAISKYSVNLLMALRRLTLILNSHACKNKKTTDYDRLVNGTNASGNLSVSWCVFSQCSCHSARE